MVDASSLFSYLSKKTKTKKHTHTLKENSSYLCFGMFGAWQADRFVGRLCAVEALMDEAGKLGRDQILKDSNAEEFGLCLVGLCLRQP